MASQTIALPCALTWVKQAHLHAPPKTIAPSATCHMGMRHGSFPCDGHIWMSGVASFEESWHTCDESWHTCESVALSAIVWLAIVAQSWVWVMQHIWLCYVMCERVITMSHSLWEAHISALVSLVIVVLNCVCVMTHIWLSYIIWEWVLSFSWEWVISYSYVWHDPFISVTWLIHACGVTHSCVWHDSSISYSLFTIHSACKCACLANVAQSFVYGS